jgi:hypothetical protein
MSEMFAWNARNARHVQRITVLPILSKALKATTPIKEPIGVNVVLRRRHAGRTSCDPRFRDFQQVASPWRSRDGGVVHGEMDGLVADAPGAGQFRQIGFADGPGCRRFNLLVFGCFPSTRPASHGCFRKPSSNGASSEQPTIVLRTARGNRTNQFVRDVKRTRKQHRIDQSAFSRMRRGVCQLSCCRPVDPNTPASATLWAVSHE